MVSIYLISHISATILIDIFFFNFFVAGKSVKSGKGSIRVFIKNTEDNIENRSNELYDEHMLILSQVAITSFQI